MGETAPGLLLVFLSITSWFIICLGKASELREKFLASPPVVREALPWKITSCQVGLIPVFAFFFFCDFCIRILYFYFQSIVLLGQSIVLYGRPIRQPFLFFYWSYTITHSYRVRKLRPDT
jgi:hypothetical protein